MLRLGEAFPDLPARDNPGLVRAEGCLPGSPLHYKPWPTLDVTTNALDGRALGALGGLSNSGAAFSFAGDATKLYRLTDLTYADVSRTVGGAYTISGTNKWQFGIYRNHMIATNLDDDVQIFTMGTDTNFRAMGTNTPKAKFFAVWRDFPVLGHTDDATDGEIAFRVWWGPPGNPEGDWTPNTDTRVGRRTLERAHQVMGLVSGDRGLVLTKKSIYVSTFVGGQIIWQLDETIKDKGCVASGSVASDLRRTFFLAEDGWYVTDGFEIRNIGHLKFNESFLKDAKADCYPEMRAMVDPERTLLLVAYVAQDAPSDIPNRIMAYDWELERVTFIDETVEEFLQSLTPGKTLEQVSSLFATLESITPSLDDRFWAGGAVVNGAFDAAHKSGTFGGPFAEAYFETGEAQLGQLSPEEGKVAGSGGSRTFLAGARPIADAATINVRVGARGIDGPLETAAVWTDYETPESRTGYAPFRSDAWFHRLAMQLPAGQVWTAAQGFDIDAEPSGDA